VGGALANAGQWRWLFYLNIPVGVITLILISLALRLPTPPGTLKEKLAKMDWIGNLIIVSSTCAIVIGLTWGGVKFAWSSVDVLAPLVVGGCGIVLFLVYEALIATNPLVPFTVLSNRTTISGYIQTFINSGVNVALIYYVPVYYQACKDASPLRSSIDMLSLTFAIGPVMVLASMSVSKLRRFRPQLWLGWAFLMIAVGAMSTLHADTAIGVGVGLLVLVGLGAGSIYPCIAFPILSPLPVSENAHALAFSTFCRSFSSGWGITVGAVVLQNELQKKLPEAFLQTLSTDNGVSLAFAAIPQIRDLPEPIKNQVRVAFGESLAVFWKVLAGCVGLGLLVSLLMRDVPLHSRVDERWTLDADAEKVSNESSQSSN